MKKIILTLVVLGLAGAGFFYWWQNQTDVRALNKTLPEGVKIEKNLFSNEYKVVNNIDGYEFKLPAEWKGLEEIVYDASKTEQEYTASSLGIEGNENGGKFIGIDRYVAGGDILNVELGLWAEKNFEIFGLVGEFTKDTVEDFAVVKTQENIHFGGEYIYFLKVNSAIYVFIGSSEEVIRYIIANGQW